MYKGFNLSFSESDFFAISDMKKAELDKMLEEPTNQYNKYKDEISRKLDKYILENNILDGKTIENSWFPEIKSHIFISHSHKDLNLAIFISFILKNILNIDCFIDSLVWGYANDLLKKVDDKYSLIENNRYDYSKTTYTSSHVHGMLTSAIANMIDKTECLIFINTKNSITSSFSNHKTESPWIYEEVLISKIIDKKLPIRKKEFSLTQDRLLKAKYMLEFKIQHTLDMGHLIPLSFEEFIKIIEIFEKSFPQNLKKDENFLDFLYEVKAT